MITISKMLFASLCLVAGSALADDGTKVTPDNFVRAESDMYFAVSAKEAGIGKMFHRREPFDVEHQTVVRGNRDTLYSSGVFDLEAGPVTITMPDAGNRFMSLMTVNQDHYVTGVFHGAGSHALTKDAVGTRYVFAAVRTLVDPSKEGDADEVHKLQDAIKVEQPGGPGKLELPTWDKASQDKVRSALLALNATMDSFNRAFGSKSDVDPINHLIGTAAGWGGNPDSEATYIAITPENNDGTTIYTLHVPANVPVDGFWSVSRYNSEGFFVPNPQKAYSVNNLTATKESDGSITIQFGGCNGKTPNCLPVEAGWNYTVRLYRPQPQVLNGNWTFPQPQPQ
ncbi:MULTISPECIES: DUF1214 domain-containing protein [unclassified Rhizobium]|uniref:DUF1214 domain-containing protein n=1 Tax=unclassified Rhizobium TaxID=2613769 RepID=UPI001ADA31C7|nr:MULTISPECIES: DUF1214 domain-containing protein [unclassified Rhizobium]MBO9123801.1 DUF1254 domain-containing protein [Rhizobium sp. 16-488-2b]MBO9174333.1 DUF1254 domain-containing protein [Rhizobium sp. 16-488-2a]